MKRVLVITAVAAVCLALGVNDALAVVITQVDPATNLAQASWSVSSDSSAVYVDLTKAFYESVMVTDSYALRLQFELETGDVGKDIYLVHGTPDVGEEVLNDTEIAWNSFLMLLVNAPSALPQYADASFVNFGAVSSDAFGSVNASGDRLEFVDGIVADDSTVHFSGVQIAHNGGAGDVFYLKEIAVPEPATMTLLALGAVGLIRRKRFVGRG